MGCGSGVEGLDVGWIGVGLLRMLGLHRVVEGVAEALRVANKRRWRLRQDARGDLRGEGGGRAEVVEAVDTLPRLAVPVDLVLFRNHAKILVNFGRVDETDAEFLEELGVDKAILVFVRTCGKLFAKQRSEALPDLQMELETNNKPPRSYSNL